jgi:sugar phosphate isomerase/epimerase
MRLGFLTACMAERGLDEIASWAAAQGFESLELAAWPAGEREHTAAHIDVNDEAALGAVPERLAECGLTVSALAFYENNLDPHPEVRAAHQAHLRRVVDAAAALRCPAVGTFVGRNPERTIAESMREAEELFPPLVDYAGERGVAVMIENCVMERWDPDRQVGNLAHTPELWEWMASLGLRLNFDPSHLVWLGIDPVAALEAALPQVAHLHAKDIELFPERRNQSGWGGSLLEPDHKAARWWRFRMPGMGQVDWAALFALLHERGYDGTVSIEHEDPVWDGAGERVEAGLRFGRATLARLLPEAL